MSLLMDALKKAEAEKKKVSEHTRERSSESIELSASAERQIPEPARAPLRAPPEPPPMRPERSPPAAPAATSRISAFRLEPMEGEEDLPWEAATESTGESTRPSASEDTTSRTDGAAPYDQESTLPSERSVKQSIQEYFESSQSLERARVSAPAPSGTEIPEIDERIGTSVSAETVFAAGAQASAARRINLIVGACVLLIAVFVAAGAYYLLQTPTPRQTPSPTVAMGVEKPITTEFVVPEITPPESRLADMEPPPGSAGAAAEPVPASRETPPAAVPETAPTTPYEPSVPESPAPAASTAGTPVIAATVPPAANAGQPLAAAVSPGLSAAERPPVLDAAAIKITKSKKQPVTNTLAAGAYEAFRAGNTDLARQLYEEILGKQPNHRDALLGLAAIALRSGQTNQAVTLYRRVLHLNPRDSVAGAALFSLQGRGGSLVSEGRLKLLLDDTPGAPHVHFALGNLYAHEGRWADAQESYFNAFRLAADNPDYAFNLAVSLDRLGQSQAAAGYYRQALDIAGGTPAGFDSALAETRIQSLSGAVELQ